MTLIPVEEWKNIEDVVSIWVIEHVIEKYQNGCLLIISMDTMMLPGA